MFEKSRLISLSDLSKVYLRRHARQDSLVGVKFASKLPPIVAAPLWIKMVQKNKIIKIKPKLAYIYKERSMIEIFEKKTMHNERRGFLINFILIDFC